MMDECQDVAEQENLSDGDEIVRIEKVYRYCQVRVKGISKNYSYIADDDLKEGAYVEVPFGADNALRKGEIMEIRLCTAASAPYPVEKTKHILREITEEEYEAETVPVKKPVKWGSAKDLLEAERLLDEGEKDNIFGWASRHHECVDMPDIMEMVVKCYRYCLEQGYLLAALNLGTLYYTGQGVPQDYQKAAELYEMAAQEGHVRALCNLGYCYYYGRHQAVDYAKAYHYFDLGALLHNDPVCLYKLGDMYMDGRFVEQNEHHAELLYERAQCIVEDEEDDEYNVYDFCLPDIEYRMGRVWLHSQIRAQDPERAFKLLCNAMQGFYERRKTDPFVGECIRRAKSLLDEAAHRLEKDL